MRKNDHKTVHKTYINTLGVPHCHITMGICVHFALNWTPWNLIPWPLEHNCPNQSDSQIANINITTIYMLLDVIWSCVRYKEFELVVFGVTLAVLTRRSASGHGVSVLVSVTGRVDSTQFHFFFNSFKKSKISSGNSCNYCINNVQTLGLTVYKQKLINFR
jgi:hypothetical protein